MNFQISDKVVCVDDKPKTFKIYPHLFSIPCGFVRAGEVYVVSGLSSTPKGVVTLILVGKPAIYIHAQWKDMGWGAHRFRRLEELKDEARASKKTVLPITAKTI